MDVDDEVKSEPSVGDDDVNSDSEYEAPSKPKTKAQGNRKVARPKTKAALSGSKAAVKKSKPRKSAGKASAEPTSEGIRCKYVNPLPVSLLISLPDLF
jgi:hypothetical protein